MSDIIKLVDNDLAAVSLNHPRRLAIKNWDKLLEGCETLSCFVGRIEKYSTIISKSETVDFFDKFGEDGANSFKGDVTEVFAEFLLKGYGRLFGVNNFKPFFVTGEEQDTGVDGTGTTKDGRIVTVQVKYGNWTEKLDNFRRGLHTFHWTSLWKYNIGTTSTDQMFIVTLTKEIDYRTLDQYFHGRLKFITQTTSGYISEHTNKPVQIISLKDICDGNKMFFDTMKEMVTRD